MTEEETLVAQAALTYAATQQQQELWTRIVELVRRAWQGLGSWRDADIPRFLDQILPILEAGQQQTAQNTAAMLGRMIQYGMDDDTLPLPTVDLEKVTGAAVRNGTEPEEVYRRPFTQLWAELAEGKPFTEARDAAENRLEKLVVTDLQLAKTHTAREVFNPPEPDLQIVGYRRVLTGAESCGLCILASTRRYRKKELLPIHPGCDCVIAPIIGEHDPGVFINGARLTDDTKRPVEYTTGGVAVHSPDSLTELDDQLLDSVHDEIEKRFGKSSASGKRGLDYRKVLLTEDHSELGPVLKVNRTLLKQQP